jgi:hypothetical protein
MEIGSSPADACECDRDLRAVSCVPGLSEDSNE